MPHVYDLGPEYIHLKDVHLIIGDGLCSNIYVIGGEEAVLVDTGVGNWMNPLWPQLTQMNIEANNISKIILTHAHHDHAMGTFLILEKADPKVYIHTMDTRYIASRLGENLVKVEEGDVIETPLWPLEVYWTPGHTTGGMCLYAREEKILFSGDTVFPDGYYGRYDGESGSLDQIVDSLGKLTKIDVEVMLPGHGVAVFKDGNSHIKKSYDQASRPR